MRPGCLWFILGGTGAVLALFTFLFNQYALPLIVNSQVAKTLELKNGTEAWDMFVHTPIQLQFKVYVMEVLNPEEAMRGHKPLLREKGPYVYREVLTKYNLSYNSQRDSVTYWQGYDMEFSQEDSGNLTEDDLVTVLNPVVAGINTAMAELPTVLNILRETLDYALPEMQPSRPYSAFSQFSVKELLFQGVSVQCNTTERMAALLVCSALKNMLPIEIITETPDGNLFLSFLKFRNTTLVGPLEVKAGLKDISMLGQLMTWKGQTTSSAWPSPCNQVQGNDMTLLSPFLKKGGSIKVFSTDICTSTRMVYKEDTKYQGIAGYRMIPGPEFMGDPSKFPQDKCLCPQSLKNLTEPKHCLKAGALDISSCLDIPVVLSQPHFLGAPWYAEKFLGLAPDPARHSSYMDLQPLTGVPLEGFRRIQVNLRTSPTTAVSVMRDITDALFPLIWLEEGAMLGEKQVDMIKDQLNVLYICAVVMWVLIGAGVAMLVVGVAMGLVRIYLRPLFPPETLPATAAPSGENTAL